MKRGLKQHILLADDDQDDCDLFKEALEELAIPASVNVVNDGMELLEYVSAIERSPDLIFLDLNMPKKSGLECIKEMKSSIKLSSIPIIIYSTSFNIHVVDELFDLGAHYYIQKPNSYSCLKKVINDVIHLISEENTKPISRANFVIKP